MLAPNPDMFRTAYQQVTPAEQRYVDEIVREIADAAQRSGRPIRDILDAPLPAALHQSDTRGWLQRPLVIAAITERVQHLSLRQDISLDRAMQELHAIATSNLNNYLRYDELGKPYFALDGLTDLEMAAVQSVEIESNEAGMSRASRSKVKIRLHPKMDALKVLLDMLGGSDDSNPYRHTSTGKGRIPTLTDQTTATQAADEYAKMIGDE